MRDSIPGIDYRFNNPDLLRAALTHRSHGAAHNERLEFLGDSVLNLVITERLFHLHPSAQEGDLSRMRARLVRGATLGDMGVRLDLGPMMVMGEGEFRSGGHRRASILADAMEALLGAIFVDGGYSASRAVIRELFDPLISGMPPAEELKDAKTRLQEWLQARGRPLPEYRLVREEGADHAKKFFVRVRLPDDGMEAEESGRSRRKAEQAAAARALDTLQASA